MAVPMGQRVLISLATGCGLGWWMVLLAPKKQMQADPDALTSVPKTATNYREFGFESGDDDDTC